MVAVATDDAGAGGLEFGGTSAGTGVLATESAGGTSVAEETGLFTTMC